MSPVVAAWGGGVNSTAMLVQCVQRHEPVDLVLFADTGGEKPETYAFRDVFAAWWKAHSGAPFISVRASSKDESLEAECLRIKSLPSKAYGYSKCSMRWKIEPQDKFVNNWEPARVAWKNGERVTKLVGFDAGEAHRTTGTTRDLHKYLYRYPLIEWGMARKECAESIVAAGLPVPPKSSCFFCPNMGQQEILDLRDQHPDLLARALAMEENWVPTDGSGIKGLGRNWSWSGFLEQERRQGKLFPLEPASSMPCGCSDGDEVEP